MAKEQETIQYTSGGDIFKAVLTSQVTDFFTHALLLPDIRNNYGEELASALLKHAKGAPFKIERYKNGHRNNGPNGEPAVEEFTEEGMAVSLYENGKLNDGPNDEPAYQRLNKEGVAVHTARHKNGERHDGPNGEPAEQISDERGKFVYIARYKDDKQLKVFTQQELAEFQAKTAPLPAPPKAGKKIKSPGM